MSGIAIQVEQIGHIEPTRYQGHGTGLLIELDMTEAQMLSALKSFLGRVTQETWGKWVAEIEAEAI